MSYLWQFFLSFVGIAIACAVGGVIWIHGSLPDVDDTVEVSGGLTAAADIVRDENGVPHIYADYDGDAWFALGYAHAQDRLWQMESMRRLAAGRLSEVVGERTLSTDRYMRTMGFNRLVEEQWKGLEDDTRAVFEAYAAGVNAWMQTSTGPLPPEFYAVRLTPEPWKPTDSLLWARLMGMRLSGNFQTELLRAFLTRILDPERVAELWPPYPGEAPTTVSYDAAALEGLDLAGLAAAVPDRPDLSAGASNAWAVSGTATASGKPVLASDPHLGFQAPIMWYLARIETPNMTLAGATVPGVPMVVLGHNGHIAWGFTTPHSDTADLFIERPSEYLAGAYETPEGSELFSIREERIHVRDGETVTLQIRGTRHGPVVSDIMGQEAAGDDGKVLALSATFLRPDDPTPDALVRLNRATGWDEVLAAAERFHSPHQNIIYADIEGNIGFLSPGRIPIRRSGRGWAPMPGWTGEADWTGFVPFDDLPRVFNPDTGRVVNANNRITPDGYAHFISDDWAAPYRAQRIEQVLEDTAGAHDPDASVALQQDVRSAMAADLIPILADTPAETPVARQAIDMLLAWDGSFVRDRPEPLLLMAWLRELERRIFADELESAFQQFWRGRPLLLREVLTNKQHWCDDARTVREETCPGIAAAALTRTIGAIGEFYGEDISAWRWGDAHQARFDNQALGTIPLFSGMANLKIETPGGSHTVNRGEMSIGSAENPFSHRHGSGFRAVYDLSDLGQSRFMIATGQSGNVLSDHYDDLLERWRDGGYLKLGTDRRTVEDTGEGTLRLEPSGS